MLERVRTDFGLDSNLDFLCISRVTWAICILSPCLTFFLWKMWVKWEYIGCFLAEARSSISKCQVRWWLCPIPNSAMPLSAIGRYRTPQLLPMFAIGWYRTSQLLPIPTIGRYRTPTPQLLPLSAIGWQALISTSQDTHAGDSAL